METSENELAFARARLSEIFPTREAHLLFQLEWYAEHGQAFDATFYTREPILEVTLDCGYANQFLSALRQGHGPRRWRVLLDEVAFSDGTIASADEIWTLNYMPRGGFDSATLDGVDMAQAEVKAGNQGETVRQIIRETYRCCSTAEEDYFIRRWIAS